MRFSFEANAIHTVMRSVPPRGSGWVCRLPIVNCGFTIGSSADAVPNWQPPIGNRQTHPLPRGGTDLTPRQKTANLFVGEAFVLPYSKTAVFILFLEITHPAPNVAYAIGIIPVAPS